jgi:hypothetical protein
MQKKNGNTHQDTNKKEERRTTPGEGTIFFLMQTKTIFKKFGKATFNLTGTFNNSKQTGQLQRKGQMEDLE